MTVPPDPDTLPLRLFGEPRSACTDQALNWHEREAGAFHAMFDGLGLRGWCLDGVELIKAAALVARDEDWGTYAPRIQRAHQHGATGAFDFRSGEVLWHTELSLQDDGWSLACHVLASSPVATNRTGLVLLHPLSCIGQHVEVEHVDGNVSSMVFPTLIAPTQPAMNIRALSYAPADGLWLELRFEGDTFEMEDQRNWLDDSFKTYCRPHALPKPYTLIPGTPVEQRITARVQRRPVQVQVAHPTRGLTRMPEIGLGVPLDTPVASASQVQLLEHLAPAFLLLEHQLGDAGDTSTAWAETARAIGAATALDVWARDDDSTPDGATLKALEPAWVTVDAPTPEARDRLCLSLAASMPVAEVGVGTRAFFMELNRDRPTAAGAFVRWTMTPSVHATDDHTLMDNNRTASWSVRSASAFSNDRPLVIGPQTLRMRFNPEAITEDGSAASDARDPRQQALFAAAWTIAHVTELLSEQVDRVALHAPFGAAGLLHEPPTPLPLWFDASRTPESDLLVYPVFLAVEALSASSGRRAQHLHAAHPQTASTPITGVRLEGDGPRYLIANTSSVPAPMPPEVEACDCVWAVLDASSMMAACTSPRSFWREVPRTAIRELGGFAVALGWD